MTRDEILVMKADRQMDALIAKELFNKTAVVAGNGAIVGVKNYSTDIAAAWEVLDKLNCAFTVARAWKIDDKEWTGFSCWIAGASALGETTPLAICRAALLAILHE